MRHGRWKLRRAWPAGPEPSRAGRAEPGRAGRAIAGGGELSQVDGTGLMGRGAVSGAGERSLVEGSGLRWREWSQMEEAVSGGGEFIAGGGDRSQVEGGERSQVEVSGLRSS